MFRKRYLYRSLYLFSMQHEAQCAIATAAYLFNTILKEAVVIEETFWSKYASNLKGVANEKVVKVRLSLLIPRFGAYFQNSGLTLNDFQNFMPRIAQALNLKDFAMDVRMSY